MRFASLIVGSLTVLSLAACGSDDGGEGDEHVDCSSAEYRDHDEFKVGLNRDGSMGLLNFKILNTDPAPPSIGFNKWQVEVTSVATVAPMANATLDVYPYMPKHGHGAGVDPVISAMPTAGDYEADEINLHMPGLWQVTITAETDAGTDSAMFVPCLPN